MISIIKFLKSIVSSFYFIVVCNLTAEGQNKFLTFYRDTLLLQGEYSVLTKESFIKGGASMKSRMWIHNPTSHFLILDYKSAYAMGEDGIAKKFKNNEDPIFLPNGDYGQKLRFKAPLRGKTVSVHFPKVFVTSEVMYSYPRMDIKNIEGIKHRSDNLTVQVLKIMTYDDVIKVRIRVIYDGDDFLAIDFHKIHTSGDKSGKIFNQVHPFHRLHHRKSKYLEMATLVFPIKRGEKLQKIHFEDVFKLYNVKLVEGFDLHFTLERDDAATAQGYEPKKQKTEE